MQHHFFKEIFMNKEQNWIDLLRKSGLKRTPIRVAVLELLAASQSARSKPELEIAFGNRENRVTIYRVLRDLEEKGLVHRVFDVEGTPKFAICDAHCSTHAHHDEHLHFNCTTCLSVYCLDAISFPTINLPEGFELKNMNFSATGICKNCINALQPLAKAIHFLLFFCKFF
ncbi:MAG: hypothetical protein RL757_1435 [Bacteroidota bacterium]